ncbi:serine/threonine-protein kinase [Brevibacillus aydinogluensis]|jgi:eukaryotic-like serine/threonine-protein kinase|uniref:Stk1 family PASTA domain-containing Ser/Thr kinase n=1 Tax=Brevibacillus aydinogluensis TaxID=927786 RepID=UPI0028931E56|nr:Stk1 family PASTA domain-containing Ser/Thr kinase [Brevibacillus aydinogluensis]MDT3414750.1 serine/threonine-protein kinase [Brevibacillus aydinogluensis]
MEGQRLGGRYQLEARIGGGGMAIVYKAKDLVLNRQVAVKVLRSQFGTDEDFVTRFRREAQAVASLSHPNVVGVYDVGQDGDTHYMVMEYVEGSTLKDLINRHGALPVEEAVRIAAEICDALDHAHQNQIIHRDIKPHNILIGKNGRVKVTDFGIARAVTSTTITHTNAVLGSVHYFSPEQARGGVTAEKSDIYSLGIVLYEMVTGQLPFSGDSPISVALKHLQEPLPEPRQVNPNIPQSVENVILKALVKDPQMRYASAREMMEDLKTCLLPERLNEEKIQFPVDDEQTKVYPAITPEMLEAQGRQGQAGQQEEESPQPRRWWVKPAMWVGAIGLFMVLAFLGFNLVVNLFPSVPEVQVPHVEGTHRTLAEERIREFKLVPKVVYEENDSVEKDIVIRQDPAPPMRLKENGIVTIYVSKGQEAIEMPNLANLSLEDAEKALRDKGFAITDNTFVEKEDDKVPAGHVIDQSPAAGEKVVPNKTDVRVEISSGPPQVTIPDVRGYNLEQAQIELFKKGLLVDQQNIRYEPAYTDKQGIVIGMPSPYEPNTRVTKGTAIPLIVSNGQYPAEARFASQPIYMEVLDGEGEVSVRITVNDARGDNQIVIDEKITESKGYDVPVVLSPQKNAVIRVHRNGIPDYQKITITYDSVP